MTEPLITITGNPLADVEILATGIRGIYQNVQTILSTWRGTLFLDRTFGINPNIIDKPMTTIRTKAMNEVITEVEKQEPRVSVVSVSFAGNDDGRLSIAVAVKIKNGVLL
jgi:phage baseplate assembly protein W